PPLLAAMLPPVRRLTSPPRRRSIARSCRSFPPATSSPQNALRHDPMRSNRITVEQVLVHGLFRKSATRIRDHALMPGQARIDHRARPSELANEIVARGSRLPSHAVEIDADELA